MYNITHLKHPVQMLPYLQYTFPRFRPYLQALQSDRSFVAIAASKDNSPTGLGLAKIHAATQSSEVLSLFVEPNHRHCGIGMALLEELERELTIAGCVQAQMVYMTGQPTIPVLERLLQKSHWSNPEPRMLVCKTTIDRIVDAPWMQKGSLPSAYTIVPWAEITSPERHAIAQTQAENPWIPSDLVPFDHEENLEPLNSVALRYHDQVVGWVITHRLAPDTIRYTCSFVRRDLQKMGRIIPLYVHAIQKQIDAKILRGIWTVPYIHTGMANFILKRMAPYMNSVEETRGSSKLLQPV